MVTMTLKEPVSRWLFVRSPLLVIQGWGGWRGAGREWESRRGTQTKDPE